MRVIAWTLHPDPEKARRAGFTYRPSLASVLSDADVVSLHLRLSPETEELLGSEAFAMMKDGAILINTARGGLIDEPALVEALRVGKLAGAGIDVFATEPISDEHPLRTLPNTVLTPPTRQGRRRRRWPTV